MLSRLTTDEDGETEINLMYESFKMECMESGKIESVPGMMVFVEHLKVLFPNAERVRRKLGTSFKTVYTKISLKPINTCTVDAIEFRNIVDILPANYIMKKISSSEIICETQSGCFSNGHSVNKVLVFHSNGTWNLIVGGKSIDLTSLYIDETFELHSEGIDLIFKCVDKIQLCGGVKVSKNIIMTRYHTLDSWQTQSNSPIRSLRSVMCTRVVPLNSKVYCCRTCQKMTFSNTDTKEKSVLKPIQENKSDPTIEQIKRLFPQANENMLSLLVEQAKNVGRHPKGRRWSQQFIGVCLQLYNRSPHCYDVLCESKILVLPSKSLLVLYKNSIKQKPGFDEEVFHWMHMEANRQSLPQGERYGGIVFDEMAIQTDIEIDKKGDIVELTGFTDYGKEGNLCHALRAGTQEKCLGKYVLQLLFLGTSGFRFPFAHFVTNSIQASELYGLFWKAVYLLYTYGFTVLYTCMDGAQSNRSFMHICLGDKPTSFIARSPCTSTDVIFLMDFSHVMKKLRNNILKSGIHPKSTRLLTLPSSYTVQWKMFVDFFEWDQQNALKLHRKLTYEHFHLDSQLKMRNHLAEEVLNSDMLHAMKVYQNSLGEKGQILNGAIELLEQTSQLVDIFRDMRPVKSTDDSRLNSLRSVSSWFQQWQCSIMENSDIPKKDKGKKLLSAQCGEDIQSCLQGFIALCSILLRKATSMYITPGLVNSDVIENIFNQQRSTYHGANSNPTALQYRRAINSVVVGQNVVSKKSNAGKSAAGSVPYSFVMKQPLRKKRSAQSLDSSVKDVKVIRL